MRFFKMNGLGNDYIFVWGDEERFFPSPEIVRKLCDGHRCVGGDGVVVLSRCGQADVRMLIFNRDGSRAEMCGNALRCVAKHLFLTEIDADSLTVETDAGIKSVSSIQDGSKKGLLRAEIGKGRYVGRNEFRLHDIYVTAHCIDVGNPHAVVFDEVEAVESVGEFISNNPVYENRVNVEFVKVLSRSRLAVRVYERGTGITKACGTGAAAAAYCSMLLGAVDNEVVVNLDGGELNVSLLDDKLFVTGPAEYNFFGEIQIDLEHK